MKKELYQTNNILFKSVFGFWSIALGDDGVLNTRMTRSRLAFLLFALFFESSMVDGAERAEARNGKSSWAKLPLYALTSFSGNSSSKNRVKTTSALQIASRFLTAIPFTIRIAQWRLILKTPHVNIYSRNGVQTRASGIRMHPGYLGGESVRATTTSPSCAHAHDVPGPVAKLPPYRVFGYALSPVERLIAIGHGITEKGTMSEELLQTNISTPRACTQYPTCSVGADFCASPYDPTKCLSVNVDSPSLDKKCQDTCQGDSGGPLFLPGNATDGAVVIGLTARGQGCGMLYSVDIKIPIPAVYTDVGLHLEWIEKTTKELETSGARRVRRRVVAPSRAAFIVFREILVYFSVRSR